METLTCTDAAGQNPFPLLTNKLTLKNSREISICDDSAQHNFTEKQLKVL